MIECCGIPQVTPFCGYCGAEIGQPHAGLTLLRHVEAAIAVIEGKLDGGYAWPSEASQDRAKKSLAKWYGWREFVATAIGAETKAIVGDGP
jgi:hypothetical protein